MTTEDLDALEKLSNYALPSPTAQATVNHQCRVAVPGLVAEIRRLRDALDEKERDKARVERDSAYRRGVEQAIRSVEGEATPSALRQAERLRSMLLDDGACRDLALEIKCKQAFRRGANAMREAAAGAAQSQAMTTAGTKEMFAWCHSAQKLADTIRALPMPEDKS